MQPSESSKVTTYHIQVKETLDQQVTRWVGGLTFIHQDNGEIFLDISFTDQEVLPTPKGLTFDRNPLHLSIDSLDKEDQVTADLGLLKDYASG